MLSPDLALLIAGAAIAGLVQGIAGFGFSTVAMSFWIWGLDPALAAAMAVFGSWTGQLVAFAAVRRALHLADLVPMLAGAALGIVLGTLLLPYLNTDFYKLLFGSILLIWCPCMLFSDALPVVRLGGRLADGAAGMVGGIMGALVGATGLAPTLWLTLRGMNKAKQRDLVQNFNLAALSATMVAYVYTGTLSQDMLPSLPVVAVALLIPSLLGSRIYRGLSDLAFRRVVLLLLTLSGLAMVLASMLSLLA